MAGEREVSQSEINVDDDVINSLKMAGVPDEELSKFIGERKPTPKEQDFEVWEENWDTFIFFEALSTQWKIVAGMSGRQVTGLDYPGIEAMMRIKNIPRNTRAALFFKLQIMEREALDVMNKPKEQKD